MKKMEHCSITIESIQLWIHPFLTQWNKINWFDSVETAKTKTDEVRTKQRASRATKNKNREKWIWIRAMNTMRFACCARTLHFTHTLFCLIDETVCVVCTRTENPSMDHFIMNITLWSSLLFAARLMRECMGCMCTDNIISSSPSNIVVSTSHTLWPLVGTHTLHYTCRCHASSYDRKHKV